MFVDPIVVILILVPIFAPVVQSVGLDPVLVGTIITLQVAIGSATVTFGCDIFTAITIFKRPYVEVIRGIFRHHSLLESSMSMVRPDDPQIMDDVMRDHARQVAENAKKLATGTGATNVRSFAKAGQPARSIVKFAEDHDAYLIVVGSRGIGDMDGFLLGSVSHKVTGLAKCPVLVV